MGTFPLVPANGRDYKNKKDLEKDFRDGKDFLCANGKPANIRLFKRGTLVSFRYASLTKAWSFVV